MKLNIKDQIKTSAPLHPDNTLPNVAGYTPVNGTKKSQV